MYNKYDMFLSFISGRNNAVCGRNQSIFVYKEGMMPERRPKQFTKYNIANYNVISSPTVECRNSKDKDKA